MGSPTTNTTQTTTVPKWMTDRGRQISDKAYGTSTAYTPQNRVTPVDSSYAGIENNYQSAPQAYKTAAGTANGVITTAFNDPNNQAQKVQGPNFSAEALSKFSNPFDQSVIESTMRDMERARQIAQVNNKQSSAGAGAFGGSRLGVQQAETDRAYDDNLFRNLAQLRTNSWDKALGQYNTDFSQSLQAGAFNNSAAAQNWNQAKSYADTTAGYGQQETANQIAAQNGAFGVANARQAVNTANTDKAAEEGRYGQQYTWDALMRQAQINAGVPHTQTTTGTQTQTGGLPPWVGPLAYGAGSMMSDERVKENVEDLDPEEVLGAFASLPSKRYDYKPEVAGAFTGRRDGFMAQDYERVFKEKSPEVGGIKVVDVPQLVGRLAVAIKGLETRTRNLRRAA